jgi:hypothetical protein
MCCRLCYSKGEEVTRYKYVVTVEAANPRQAEYVMAARMGVDEEVVDEDTGEYFDYRCWWDGPHESVVTPL